VTEGRLIGNSLLTNFLMANKSGLFRGLNPIFVAVFAFLTRFVFRVAVSEDVGGQRLAYMIGSPMLNKITGAYYSGDPFTTEFKLYEVSKEAKNPETGRRLWELTDKLLAIAPRL
jgi:hypothetical protein